VTLGPGEGSTVSNPVGGPLTFKAQGVDTRGALTALESTAAPGEGPPLHAHADADEVIFVAEGTFRFSLNGELRDAPAGSFMYAPRTVPHAWQNVGPTPGRLFVVFTPAAMEGFFRAFSEQVGARPPAEAFRALGEEAGMDVLGPPLAQSHPLGAPR